MCVFALAHCLVKIWCGQYSHLFYQEVSRTYAEICVFCVGALFEKDIAWTIFFLASSGGVPNEQAAINVICTDICCLF